MGIKIFDEDVADIREKGAKFLIGRLWAEKKINKEAFRTSLARLWRVVNRISFKEIQDNIWIFEFSEEEDKNRVLEGRPWSFERQILVINDFDGQIPPSQMEFTKLLAGFKSTICRFIVCPERSEQR